jgi:hypothetical protein
MAANPNVGADAQAGAGGQPDQPVSPQAQSPIESEATKLLAALESKLDGRFKSLEDNLTGLKKVQGDIDRSRNAFQEQLARLKQYQAQGLSEPDALAAMQKDDGEAQWRTSLEKKLDTLAAQLANGGTQASGQQTVAKVFEAIGLDVKDPRVASALLTQYKSADEVELAAYRLQHQIQQSPNPNPAQNPSLTGSTSQRAADLEAVYAQYQEAFREPTKNAELLKNLETQMKQLGG